MNTTPNRFRFNALPLELRNGVYKHLAPLNERIALDPTNISTPSAFVGTAADPTTLNYLLVSKDFSREFTSILYSQNTFILIRPLASTTKLTNLNHLALSSLRHVEVRVKDGISDLAPIWDVLEQKCVSLNEVTLVFYHDKYQWWKSLADFAMMDGPKPKLNLNLFSSIWSLQKTAGLYREELLGALEEAGRRKVFVQIKPFPQKIQTINITASASDTAAYGFLTAKRGGQAVFVPCLEEESEVCSRLSWVGN